MKTMVASVLLTAAAVALPQAAQAEGLVRLRAGVANTSYSVKFDTSADPWYQGKTGKSDYTARTVGLTFVSGGGFYVDVTGQTSGDAKHDLWNPQPEQEFSRDDFTVTLGISVPTQSGTGSFFGGYKSGTTELNAPKGAVVPGTGTPIGWNKDTFDTKGFFFGGGYAFPAAGGQIGLNGAIAFMTGRWTDDSGYSNEADYTIGFSLGLSYTYMFGRNFGLTADLRSQHYSYGFNQGGTTFPAYTVDEQINSLGLSALVQF